MAEPRPSFDKNTSNSVPLRKRIKGIEEIKANKIVDRLLEEGKWHYKSKNHIMVVINSFLREIQKEVGEGRKVVVQNFGFFYPAKLPDKKHYCGVTGRVLPKRKGSTMLRFMQKRSMREYFKENFKGIKRKNGKEIHTDKSRNV